MPRPRPSRTALKIARFLLLIDATPRLRGLLPAGAAATAERLLRASRTVPGGLVSMMRRPAVVRLAAWIDRRLAPGMIVHFGLRKRAIAEAVREALDDGADQLLVVGAGFDPLCVQIAGERPGVLCVEIDRPATAGPKRSAVLAIGAARDNLHLRAADLATESLASVLATTPWSPARRSVVVAEGVLMYLDVAAVTGFLRDVRALVAPQSRLVFTFLRTDDRGRPRLGALDRLTQWSLRRIGEPIRWGIEPASLGGRLAAVGFALRDLPDERALRARFLAPLGLGDEPIVELERLAIAAAV